MGRRALLFAEGGGMVDIGRTLNLFSDNPNVNDNNLWIGQYGAGLQYVRSTHKAYALHYRFQMATHDVRVLDDNSLMGTNPDSSAFQIVLGNDQATALTQMQHFSFGWVWYDKGYVAPAGTFTELEIGGVFYQSRFIQNVGETIENKSSWGIAPILGINRMRQHILLNRFVLQYGFQLNLNVLGMYNAIMLSGYQNNDMFQDDVILRNHAVERTFETSSLLFKLGFGFLAF